METTLKVNINKSQRGWSVLTEVQYPEFTHPARTSKGANTLNHALWQTLDPRSYVDNIKLIELTVNGKEMTPAVAFKRIEKDLTDSSMDYAIPRYKAFLQ
jgi:hypothetical protein